MRNLYRTVDTAAAHGDTSHSVHSKVRGSSLENVDISEKFDGEHLSRTQRNQFASPWHRKLPEGPLSQRYLSQARHRSSFNTVARIGTRKEEIPGRRQLGGAASRALPRVIFRVTERYKKRSPRGNRTLERHVSGTCVSHYIMMYI